MRKRFSFHKLLGSSITCILWARIIPCQSSQLTQLLCLTRELTRLPASSRRRLSPTRTGQAMPIRPTPSPAAPPGATYTVLLPGTETRRRGFTSRANVSACHVSSRLLGRWLSALLCKLFVGLALESTNPLFSSETYQSALDSIQRQDLIF